MSIVRSVFFLCLFSFLFTQLAFAEVWISRPNWLEKPLEFAPYEELRMKVESKLNLKLKHRGEAHITVLAPPEYEKIKNSIDIKKLENLFKDKIMNASWQMVCVGMSEHKGLKTFYLVVKSDDLINIRREIKRLSSLSDFNPLNFFPHVTLGFTDRDLHAQDGAIKNESSCPKELSNL